MHVLFSHESQIGALQVKQQEILDDIAQFKGAALVSFVVCNVMFKMPTLGIGLILTLMIFTRLA